jgi:hypothetical protein
MVPATPPPLPPLGGGGGGGGGLHFPCQSYLLFTYLSFSFISLFAYIVFNYVYFTYKKIIYFVYNGSAIKQKTRLEINPGGADINLDCIYLRGLRYCTLPDRAYTTEEVGTTRFASAFTS